MEGIGNGSSGEVCGMCGFHSFPRSALVTPFPEALLRVIIARRTRARYPRTRSGRFVARTVDVETDRVALGDCSPGAPADPDVPD